MRRLPVVATFLVVLGLVLSTGPVAADPGGPNAPASGLLGTFFTYQGRLNSGSTPFDGSCDMAFRLYDDALAGAQVGSAITTTVAVAAGLFTVPLDFGVGVFDGNARWLAIQVKCGADISFTPLDPRQPLTAAPYALALPGLYTWPNAISPNVIGGYSGNLISPTVVGAVIAGGGKTTSPTGPWLISRRSAAVSPTGSARRTPATPLSPGAAAT